MKKISKPGGFANTAFHTAAGPHYKERFNNQYADSTPAMSSRFSHFINRPCLAVDSGYFWQRRCLRLVSLLLPTRAQPHRGKWWGRRRWMNLLGVFVFYLAESEGERKVGSCAMNQNFVCVMCFKYFTWHLAFTRLLKENFCIWKVKANTSLLPWWGLCTLQLR